MSAEDSIRIGLTLSGDADPVVGKGMMHARNLDLYHMTPNAIGLAHAARERPANLALDPARTSPVAAQADLVVRDDVLNQRFMWVVTGDAG